ncbi:ferredoxin [Arthrobacter sp. NPDC058127]|uniref:ferredoxin n=1 Tax=Arthrobacter sp. NPDC058127 TaxID=3346351 RepID=UPI0036E56173
MPYVVTEACVDIKDNSCIVECPVDCIYEGERMMYIQPMECIDCGACEAACPVQAIYFSPEVPAELEQFVGYNEEFFAEIGSPRSARKFGKSGRDVPGVAALPAKGTGS